MLLQNVCCNVMLCKGRDYVSVLVYGCNVIYFRNVNPCVFVAISVLGVTR